MVPSVLQQAHQRAHALVLADFVHLMCVCVCARMYLYGNTHTHTHTHTQTHTHYLLGSDTASHPMLAIHVCGCVCVCVCVCVSVCLSVCLSVYVYLLCSDITSHKMLAAARRLLWHDGIPFKSHVQVIDAFVETVAHHLCVFVCVYRCMHACMYVCMVSGSGLRV